MPSTHRFNKISWSDPKSSTGAIRAFRKLIYGYYGEHGRPLPWRATRDPYHIVVSEVMLQQTQVDRVLEKYEQFIAAFPDFRSLSLAPLRRVLSVWRGLGYNRRALALKRIAEIVGNEHGGVLPSDVQLLQKLPGIGHATACSIAAFAFDAPTVFIETNIRTVFIHFFFRRKRSVKDSDILRLVARTLDTAQPGKWYHALMDYGAMLKRGGDVLHRRSSHYRKQAPFKGSDRQIRGMILKALLARRAMTENEIVRELKLDASRGKKCIEDLQREGLVAKRAKRIRIA